MRVVKALVRLILLVTTAAILVFVYGVGYLFAWSSRRWIVELRSRLIRIWGVAACGILGVKVVAMGPIPKRPFCLISNHLSYVDVIVFQRLTGCILISKTEISGWPIVGMLSRTIGTLFIDRTRAKDVVRVSAEIQDRLQAGDGIVFFPEGTSSDASRVLPFKSALLNYFSSTSYPVQHATIRYSSAHFDVSSRVCWWGDMTFAPHFWTLMKQRSFTCFVKFGDTGVTDSDRKVLTQKLHQIVSRNLQDIQSLES